MGHLVSKQIWKDLGERVGGNAVSIPQNEKLYTLLKEFYTDEEAQFGANMPFSVAKVERIAELNKMPVAECQKTLTVLADKGLVLDLGYENTVYYMLSPIVIGIFEFSMMRAGNHPFESWSKIFHEYLEEDEGFIAKYNDGSVRLGRVMAYEEAIRKDFYSEILDYEKLQVMIDKSDTFSLGTCACRHTSHHNGDKDCDNPLNTCMAMGFGAEHLIKHKMAKQISKNEILSRLDELHDRGLVHVMDNVKKNPSFLCNCCGCCCAMMTGINKFGYQGTIVTSNYIARVVEDKCNGCKACEKACPVNAISMVTHSTQNKNGNKKMASVNQENCLGCGVCNIACEKTKAIALDSRKQKVFTPENTFERLVAMSLEKGNLQNLIFDEPYNITHQMMRGLLGAFLKQDVVKKTLMSDLLRSRFLQTMTSGASLLGMADITKM